MGKHWNGVKIVLYITDTISLNIRGQSSIWPKKVHRGRCGNWVDFLHTETQVMDLEKKRVLAMGTLFMYLRYKAKTITVCQWIFQCFAMFNQTENALLIVGLKRHFGWSASQIASIAVSWFWLQILQENFKWTQHKKRAEGHGPGLPKMRVCMRQMQ